MSVVLIRPRVRIRPRSPKLVPPLSQTKSPSGVIYKLSTLDHPPAALVNLLCWPAQAGTNSPHPSVVPAQRMDMHRPSLLLSSWQKGLVGLRYKLDNKIILIIMFFMLGKCRVLFMSKLLFKNYLCSTIQKRVLTYSVQNMIEIQRMI